MLKWASKSTEGRPVLGFGLDATNIKYLQAGRPIIAKVSIGGTVCDIVIHYGETQAKMLKDLRDAGINLPPGSVMTVPQSIQ
jgi:hypothetical protein